MDGFVAGTNSSKKRAHSGSMSLPESSGMSLPVYSLDWWTGQRSKPVHRAGSYNESLSPHVCSLKKYLKRYHVEGSCDLEETFPDPHLALKEGVPGNTRTGRARHV